MLSENKWKVLLLVAGTLVSALDKPTQSLSRYTQKYPVIPYGNVPMFFPKRSLNYKRNRARQSRVLFLDDEERSQQYGRGEIDLTVDKNYDGQIKFDQESDYDFTSPEDGTESSKTEKEELKDEPSGNERFYDSPRLRPAPFSQGFVPKYYQGRYSRPYAPNHYAFEPYFPSPGAPFAPAVRNGFYSNAGGWKARSPRVVFPYAQDTSSVNTLNFQTNSHGGPGGGFNDNVVFRDQNFGLNDVVSDDLALQDLGTGNADAFAERDANDPHRARNDKINNRMDIYGRTDLIGPQYIPIYRNYHPSKAMFIQTDTTRILPPNLASKYEFTNISRNIGENNAVLPKFKPISDEQMLKINEILNDLPMKPTTKAYEIELFTEQPYFSSVKPGRFRKGKAMKDNLVEGSAEVSTEQTTLTTKGIERQDEKKCPQGGTCEFFIYCWMVGGLLEGSCGGLLKGCCHRVAKAGILGVQDSNNIDYSSESTGLSYGPVINDQSKSDFVIATNRAAMWSFGKT